MKTNKKLGIIVASIIIAVILAFGAFKEQTNVHAFTFAKQITFGGSNAEEARAVAIWGTSKVIVGYTNSFGAGGYDAFIAVNDTTLNMWTIGTSDNDFAYSVAVAGNFAYIVGTRYDPNNYYDIFIAKWNLAAQTLVATKFIASGINNPIADIAYAVATDGTYVFVTGSWAQSNSFLAILDSNLNIINFASLDLGPGNDIAYAIDFKSSAGVYNIIIGGATNTAPTFGGYDAFITRIDWDSIAISLTQVWSLRFGTSGNDYVTSLKFTDTNTFVVAGASNNNGFLAGFTIDGGFLAARATVFSNPSVITSIAINGTYLYAAGYFNNPPNQDDAFVLQIDSNGALVDAKGYGRGTIDRAFGIAIVGNSINVVGSTSTYPNNVYDAKPLFSFSLVQWNPLVTPTYTPYMQSASILFTIAAPTPATYTPSVSISSVTPNINSPTGVEAFYVRFTLP
jgi:hypothetical protein